MCLTLLKYQSDLWLEKEGRGKERKKRGNFNVRLQEHGGEMLAAFCTRPMVLQRQIFGDLEWRSEKRLFVAVSDRAGGQTCAAACGLERLLGCHVGSVSVWCEQCGRGAAGDGRDLPKGISQVYARAVLSGELR